MDLVLGVGPIRASTEEQLVSQSATSDGQFGNLVSGDARAAVATAPRFWSTLVGDPSVDGPDVVGGVLGGAADAGDGACGGRSGGDGASGDDGVGVDVASRRARHPRVAGARIARGGYHWSVIVAIRVDIGGRRTRRCLLVIRQPLLLLLTEDLVGEVLDEGEGLSSLVAHQADSGLLHYAVEQHQVLVLQGLLLGSHEVIPQVVLELGALLADVREVDEESRAHVPLEGLDVVGLRRFVHLHKEVTILEQATTTDLLGMPRGDELFVKVMQRLLEVSVHGLTHHGGVEVFADWQLAALVEQ